MTTKSTKNTAQIIAGRVQDYIRDNGLVVGDSLPSIDKMAKQFSVSNSTMREAMQHLAAGGFVRIEQGRGTYITQPSASDLFDTPAWSTFASGMTPQELKKALETIYGTLMELTANNITLAEIRHVGELLDSMKHAAGRADYVGYTVLEKQLRSTLAKIAKNRFLGELSDALWSLPVFDMGEKNVIRFTTLSLSYYQDLYRTLISGEIHVIRQLAEKYIKAVYSLEPHQDLVIYYDTLGTGSLGGSFYTLGQGIAKLIGDNAQIKLDINVTGGGIDNVKLAQDRKIAIGITQADVAHNAFHGVGGFEYPHENIRLIGCLPGLELQVSTLATSDIWNLEQLRGRTIAVGAHGGASVEVARQVLEQAGLKWGIDYDPKIVSFATSVDMLCNQLVDAVFYLSIGQSPALLELALRCPIRLIELEDDLMKSLEECHPYWYRTVIETNTYPNQQQSVRTIGIPTILVTHKDLPEADAHAMTASIFVHTEEIQSLVWPPRTFRLQEATREVGIPYHVGAERFFKKYKMSGNGDMR